MKNTLLFVCVMCLSAGALLSQNTDQIKVGTNLKQSIIQTHDGPASFFPSWLNKSIAATANINAPCDSSWAELIATSGICSIWYSDPGLTTVISSGDTLMVNNITADTTVYLSNYAVTAGDSALPLPAHASTYSDNVRGYYFTAPVSFVIEHLWVPTEANSGTQNVEIVRFTNGAPPLWSATTNDFVSLGLWQGHNANDTINVCIPVAAGDIIGIYGNRGDVNSYAPSPANSMIGGVPVTLTRSGMQLPLSGNPMQDIFSETGGSISRVEMIYRVITDTASGPILITHNTTPNVTMAAFNPDSICIQDGQISLPAGTPAGGTYTGTGVSGMMYDPGLSGSGEHTVIYTYSDSSGCTNSDMAVVNVLDCASLAENAISGVDIYPVPASDILNINFNDLSFETLSLRDATGRVIYNHLKAYGLISIDVSKLASGMYYLVASNHGEYQVQRIIVEQE